MNKFLFEHLFCYDLLLTNRWLLKWVLKFSARWLLQNYILTNLQSNYYNHITISVRVDKLSSYVTIPVSNGFGLLHFNCNCKVKLNFMFPVGMIFLKFVTYWLIQVMYGSICLLIDVFGCLLSYVPFIAL